MSKRFTDSCKFRDPWYRALPWQGKLLWEYVLAECDCAGLWKPDTALAEFQIGTRLDWQKLPKLFVGRIVVLPGGHWWVPSFVLFQYAALSPTSNPHKGVIRLLEQHGLMATYDAWLLDWHKKKGIIPPAQRVPEGFPNPSRGGVSSVSGIPETRAGASALTVLPDLPSPFVPPTLSEWHSHARTFHAEWPAASAEAGWNYYRARKWRGIEDWHACVEICHGNWKAGALNLGTKPAAPARVVPVIPEEPEAWRLFLKDKYEGEDWAESAAACTWPLMPAHWQTKIIREMGAKRRANG